jgi:hypothetical protein
MFQASTACHQEVRRYVANGTSKMTVSEPGRNGTSVEFHSSQAHPEYVEVFQFSKLRMNSASSWFLCT